MPNNPRQVPISDRGVAWYTAVAEVMRDSYRPVNTSVEDWIRDRIEHWHAYLWEIGAQEPA